MSTNGPDTGLRSRMEASRARQRLLEIDGQAGVVASPETVARIVSARAFLAMAEAPSIEINLGAGRRAYSAGDLDLLLGLCGEAFARFDAG